MNKENKIYIAGHRGMVGSAIHRALVAKGYDNFLLRTSSELDLRDQHAVNYFFAAEKPDYVFLAAAKVGGIYANNTFRAEFIYENIMIAANVIHAAYLNQVKKLLNLGSSCIYPKNSAQPIREAYLLTAPLEPTNEPYAIAKIAAIKLCDAYRSQYGCNFISGMPTNLYGPNDNFDLQTSHVLPALLRKFYEGQLNNEPFVEVWGSGNPRREFLHVDDMAAAALFLMDNYNEAGPINIGTGKDLSIKELASLIASIAGYSGELRFDSSKPDGTMQKLQDVSKINTMGWQYRIELEEGIRAVYEAYKKNKAVLQ